jgi:hypothetical protein
VRRYYAWINCLRSRHFVQARGSQLRSWDILHPPTRVAVQAVLTTTIALDMLGHYTLTDKVFEAPDWFKVVMVEPTGMKPVKLVGAGGATFALGNDEHRIYSHTVTKPERLD